jgi:hypothetical protein
MRLASTTLTSALASISDRELQGLQSAIYGAPNMVPGLMAWLDSAVDWEIHRRLGFNYELQGPTAAIPDADVESSLAALAVLAGQFLDSGDPGRSSIGRFFTATAQALRTEVERPDRRNS